jgi:predicted metal-dependent hydrolase
MNTKSDRIQINDLDIEIVRKEIKNLHVAVYPPNGYIRVATPAQLHDEQVRLAVVSRLPWIRKQQTRLRNQVRQSAREMLDGESHFLWGQRYRLKVVERPGRPEIRLRGSATLELCIPSDAGRDRREAVLTEWYRVHLKAAVPALIAKWQPVLGVDVNAWGVRKMKTRWGSCNTDTGKLWLNLELAKKPPRTLEYILVHEMTHLIERHHNDRFTALLDAYLPQWRTYRDELNELPLKHEDWVY